ncbi:carbon starvation CstA family protein [Sphingobacterium sp.]|uniref:carbon starvation CstA family protein n=1 Tax=Sphingobacterium sp. TaxID=341027 RepID=UPI0031D45020
MLDLIYFITLSSIGTTKGKLLKIEKTIFIHGTGPVIGGPVLPFTFIVIARGAISGLHAIIATGTRPKKL